MGEGIQWETVARGPCVSTGITASLYYKRSSDARDLRDGRVLATCWPPFGPVGAMLGLGSIEEVQGYPVWGV